MHAVKLRSVEKRFETNSGSVHALEDIDLEIADHQFVSLVGPSGCGKSTLLRILSGLETPTSGHVEILGETHSRSPADLGFVFQKAVLLPWRNVWDNIGLGKDLLKLRAAEAVAYDERASTLVEAAGLAGFMDNYPKELSGGMQQRASICRALASDPKVLLMDEPFGALDAMTREEMSEVLLDLWERTHKTVVFVTHSIPEAVLLSDRVIVMSARPGRIMEDVAIELPRPRSRDLEEDARFLAITSHIRSLIYNK